MNYCVRPASGRAFEVDLFISSQSLALEYNGEYHYRYVPMYTIVLCISLHHHTLLISRCETRQR